MDACSERARGGGIRTVKAFVNGLRRAWRKYHDVRHTLVAGDMKVSRESMGQTMKQGGTAN